MNADVRITCQTCGGCGELHTSHAFDCYDCDGRGWTTERRLREREAEDLRGAILVSRARIREEHAKININRAKLGAMGRSVEGGAETSDQEPASEGTNG